MSIRRRRLWLVGVSAFILAVLPGVASSVPLPVEAVNEGGIYGETHRWSNVPQTIAAGEKVTFSNPTEVPHGVEWRSATKPVCEEGPKQVPVGTTFSAAGTKWSGKCTFSQAGSYLFYCTVHGAAMSGTITVANAGEPTASTRPATAVSETEATLHGTVNPSGHPTTYSFKYGTTTGYGKETSVQSAGEGTADVAASAALSGLAPGTTYHYLLVAKNEKGIVEGADETFTTASPPAPPIAVTSPAASVSETEATLKGTVNPGGEATKYLFEYGTSTAYGKTTTELVLSATDHAAHLVSATITGLTPGTTYHFRLLAKNTHGPSEGSDQQFTTAASPITEPSPATTSTNTTPPPTPGPISPEPELAPLTPPVPMGSLKLTAGRHSTSVRGSLKVSNTGAGGRLEIDLLTSSASLGRRGHSKQVIVGRLLRTSLSMGEVSFSISLNASAKSALRRHHRLALTVHMVLTPKSGQAVTATRSVLLKA